MTAKLHLYDQICKDLEHHEGYREHMYKCPAGVWTIGFGFNLEEGLKVEDARYLMRARFRRIRDGAFKRWPWSRNLPDGPLSALLRLAYNMGNPRLSQFVKTLAALEAGEWERAAVEVADSRWARQVGESRVSAIQEMMRLGG